ncbi:FecR family protein [Chromobacterium sphagni]|uniref:FecR protein domain-containing protein n=1 Tax=Chromobacterium sphagni TaxID=1903179 RepID=A0A1S1X2L1_9NEIS|nr:FecR domain-containing protein [Chromobacterium sphagni]OHX13618.1 hypothetical protein BI347_08905 [Chromobacterium sphagni]OHX18463.1 hypothetical protein BI344_20385 [Chromobacterium sphagni]
MMERGQAANQELPEAQAARWRLREQQGLSQKEKRQLADWLDASAEHRRAYAALHRVDTLLDGLSAAERLRLSAMARPPRRQPWLAACAVLLLTCGLLWQWRAAQPQWRMTLATAPGQQLSRTLDDGSRLQLDADSRIELSYFAGRREARLLQGQAMFDVRPDAARPFRVAADKVRVTVLGTRFAVRNLYGEVAVAVAHGKVRVARYEDADAAAGSADDSRQRLLLVDGQQARLRQGLLQPPQAVAPQAVASWRAGRLDFVDQPLADVLREFERYGPAGLALADARLGGLRLSGSFASRDPAAFARILPQVLPVRVRPGPGGRLIDAR